MSIHKSLLYTIPAVWATRAIAILDFLFIIRSSESGTSGDAPRPFAGGSGARRDAGAATRQLRPRPPVPSNLERSAAMKNTKQREAMLCVLRQSTDPLSAEDIFAQMKAAFPSLALSTIYRNLERFAADALVERSDFGDGVVRYSLAREQHGHYLVCTGCHAKIKLCDCPLSGMERTIAEETGFTVESHTLTIYGKCPKCAKKPETGGTSHGI